ncbi:hypothetical protein B0H21DRAFT_779881 [Amylocystis lapponica]|nr:hypothetical protein B0H21DRAFT_779881 [Amylocystis lapponica]
MTDVAGAKDDFLASIELQPSLTQTWVKIASVYMEQGDPKKAFDCFEEAIKHNSDDPDIYYHRGQVLFIMNEFTEAAQNYTKSTALDENFVFSHIQLAVAQYKSGNLANSMATFRRTLKAFAQRSEPQNYYGELLLDQQRFEDAVDKFDRAIELELAKPPPINALPQWKQDIGAAEHCCQEALRIDPECEAAVATLAQLSLQQGKVDVAIEMFDRQAELARSEPELMNALTYQFTPTPTDPGAQAKPPKKSRRQIAFYPNMKTANKPEKPFSRSAAKRESVMALGSIEHLQHYFTKSGIAAETNPLNKPHAGMVPAIGGPSNIRTKGPFLPKAHDFDLPPSPAIPQIVQPSFPTFVKTYETDPDSLRPGVIDDLNTVAAGWTLGLNSEQPTLPVAQDPNLLGVGERHREHVDVLDLLKSTTRAVRNVRNYLISLPDDSATPRLQQYFRPMSLQSLPLPKRNVSQPDSPLDPLSRIRRGALEVLTVLRELEESARLPLEDDAYDAQSDHGSFVDAAAVSRGTSPSSHLEDATYFDGDTSVSISLVQVGGRQRSIPVWEDEAAMYDMNHLSEEEREKRARWDERLVVGGGWLYRQDVGLADLARERDVVRKYLDTVDSVLFGGARDGQRGWERERERMEKADRAKGRRASSMDVFGNESASRRSSRRVVSTGMLDAMRDLAVTEEPEDMDSITEEDSIDDEDLPDWAKRSTFAEDPLGRLHAILVALLPSTLLPLLPMSSSNRTEFLQALSSGQLLCVSYNVGVRRSRKQWGFDGQDGDKGKRGWTFRRTDNLRLWAAALKLRYLLPIAHTPTDSPSPAGSPSPSMMRFPSTAGEDSIVFDAPLVARLDSGWDDMLEAAVLKWVDAIVDERRGER